MILLTNAQYIGHGDKTYFETTSTSTKTRTKSTSITWKYYITTVHHALHISESCQRLSTIYLYGKHYYGHI